MNATNLLQAEVVGVIIPVQNGFLRSRIDELAREFLFGNGIRLDRRMFCGDPVRGSEA
jgi:hypothetical protein